MVHESEAVPISNEHTTLHTHAAGGNDGDDDEEMESAENETLGSVSAITEARIDVSLPHLRPPERWPRINFFSFGVEQSWARSGDGGEWVSETDASASGENELVYSEEELSNGDSTASPFSASTSPSPSRAADEQEGRTPHRRERAAHVDTNWNSPTSYNSSSNMHSSIHDYHNDNQSDTNRNNSHSAPRALSNDHKWVLANYMAHNCTFLASWTVTQVRFLLDVATEHVVVLASPHASRSKREEERVAAHALGGDAAERCSGVTREYARGRAAHSMTEVIARMKAAAPPPYRAMAAAAAASYTPGVMDSFRTRASTSAEAFEKRVAAQQQTAAAAATQTSSAKRRTDKSVAAGALCSRSLLGGVYAVAQRRGGGACAVAARGGALV